MLIPFPEMEYEVLHNLRDGKNDTHMKRFLTDNKKVLFTRLEPGCSIGVHTHDVDCETYFYVSGTGKVCCDGEWEPVKPGYAHHCPKGHSHGIENTGDEDLLFFALISEE